MIEYPNIDPVAISIPISGFWGDSLNIYWYGLAYVVGAYLIYLRMLQTRKKFSIEIEKNETEDLVIMYGLLFAVIGGRLGSVIFYDFHLQLQDPLGRRTNPNRRSRSARFAIKAVWKDV